MMRFSPDCVLPIFGIIFVSLQLFSVFVQGAPSSCPAAPLKVGCYKDKLHHRALGELLFQDRGEGDKFSGQLIDWANFEAYLKGLACRCATAAAAKGYTYFGLQFYGECFSSPDNLSDHARYGESDQCVEDTLVTCDDESDAYCVGLGNANYVYRVTGKV